jgi:hypothetical protein
VVDWLQLVVGMTVSVPPELATMTSFAAASRATASGPVPVVTEPAVPKFVGLLVLPSLSTLTVLLASLAI